MTGRPGPGTPEVGALGRAIRRGSPAPVPAGERCDLCAVTLPAGHRHLLDSTHHTVRCVCHPCSVLFNREAAGNGQLLLIPGRRQRLPEVPTAPLGVPVGLAFFVVHPDGSVHASYPGPAGPTRWQVDATAWRRTQLACPPLAGLVPDVQALLVNTSRGRSEHWLAPIDDCFALVNLVRTEWRGLSGGTRLWPRIDAFFGALTERRG